MGQIWHIGGFGFDQSVLTVFETIARVDVRLYEKSVALHCSKELGWSCLAAAPLGRDMYFMSPCNPCLQGKCLGPCRPLRSWGPSLNVFSSGHLEKSHLKLGARGYYSKPGEKLGFVLSRSGGNGEKENAGKALKRKGGEACVRTGMGVWTLETKRPGCYCELCF